MRWLPVLLLATRVAQADDDVLVEETRTAHDAAVSGQCDVAMTIAIRIKNVDHNYYTRVVLADPAIAACLATPAIRPPSLTPAAPIDTPASDEKPPLSGLRIGGELVVGGLTGAGGVLVGGAAGYALEMSSGCGGEFCGLGGMVIGGWLGMVMTVPVGVYLVGSAGEQTGSLGATYAGSLLGGLVGVGLAALAHDAPVSIPLVVVAPIVGSVLGFNLSRRYKTAVQITPTVRTSGDQLMAGLGGRF